MVELILVGKLVSLFFAVAYSFTNVSRVFAGQNIPPTNVYLMSAGISIFVALQWLI